MLVAVLLVATQRAAAAESDGQALAKAVAAHRWRQANALVDELDPAVRPCGRAVVAAGRHHMVRAHLLFVGCPTKDGPLAAVVAGARRRNEAALEAGRYAPVVLAVTPSSARVSVAGYPGLTVPAEASIWLPMGRHTLVATAPGFGDATTTVVVDDRDRQTIIMDLTPVAPASTPAGQDVDFTQDTALEQPTTGSLEARKYVSLLPDRYAKRRRVPPTPPPPVRPRRWFGRLQLELGASWWSKTDELGSSAGVTAALGRQYRWLSVELGLGLGQRGGGGDQNDMSLWVTHGELLARGHVRSGGGHGRWTAWLAAGPGIDVPLEDGIADRMGDVMVTHVVNRAWATAIVEAGLARRVGSTWLDLGVRANLGLTEAEASAGASRSLSLSFGARL